MNFLLKVLPEDYTTIIIETKGLTDTLLFGLEMVLIGMATVFAVLIILWIALTLFKAFFSGKKDKTEKVAPAPAPVAAPVVTASADEELVAVIAAAIAMAESESNGVKFRVVSFKRK